MVYLRLNRYKDCEGHKDCKTAPVSHPYFVVIAINLVFLIGLLANKGVGRDVTGKVGPEAF